jgi:hypothetical protein
MQKQSTATCAATDLCKHFATLQGWRHTCITTDNFLGALPATHNKIFDLPGFHLELIRPDFMHCAFLGLFMSTCGTMIWELQELGHFGPCSLPVATRLASAFASWEVWLRSSVKATWWSTSMVLMATGQTHKGNSFCETDLWTLLCVFVSRCGTCHVHHRS